MAFKEKSVINVSRNTTILTMQNLESAMKKGIYTRSNVNL